MKKLVMWTSSGESGDIAVVDGLSFEDCMRIQEPLKKLAEYEKAEEEGRLIVLPISIGKRVYESHFPDVPQKVTGYVIGTVGYYDDEDDEDCDNEFPEEDENDNGIRIAYETFSGGMNSISPTFNLGKTIFRTKQEAKRAAKGGTNE